MDYSNAIDKARDSYSLEWELTSNFFQQKGYYDWCAKNVPENSKVLEIGVGIGNSSISLIKRKCKIIGIEENMFNLEKAISLFRKHKIYCGKILRENFIDIKDDKYAIDYFPMDDIPSEFIKKNDITVILGDFIVDELFKKWLSGYEKFDVIVCWFAGVHGIVYKNLKHTVTNPVDYRELLHDFLFEYGPSLLKPNGLINICDRLNQVNSETAKILMTEIEKIYKFEERNLEIKSTSHIIVDGFDTPGGIDHEKDGNIDKTPKALYSLTVGLKHEK